MQSRNDWRIHSLMISTAAPLAPNMPNTQNLKNLKKIHTMTTAVGIVTHQNDIIHLIITITTEIVTIVIPIEKVIRQEKGCIRHLAMAKITGTEIITDQIAGITVKTSIENLMITEVVIIDLVQSLAQRRVAHTLTIDLTLITVLVRNIDLIQIIDPLRNTQAITNPPGITDTTQTGQWTTGHLVVVQDRPWIRDPHMTRDHLWNIDPPLNTPLITKVPQSTSGTAVKHNST